MNDSRSDDSRWNPTESLTSSQVLVFSPRSEQATFEESASEASSASPRPADRRLAPGHFLRSEPISSPTLSSSSHTPSSSNIDDCGSEISDLHESDYEIIDLIHRPESALSRRSRDSTLAQLEPGPDSHDSRPAAPVFSLQEPDANALTPLQSDPQDAEEAALLNSNLSATYALSRYGDQLRQTHGEASAPEHGEASVDDTPQASFLVQAQTSRENHLYESATSLARSMDATPSVAGSQFTFPDPLHSTGLGIGATTSTSKSKAAVLKQDPEAPFDWFKDDKASAQRANMALSRAEHVSSLGILMPKDEDAEGQQPTWLVKTRNWLRGSSHEELLVATGSSEGPEMPWQMPHSKEAGRPAKLGSDKPKLYSIARTAVLVLSLISFGALIGSGNVPFSGLRTPANVATPLSRTTGDHHYGLSWSAFASYPFSSGNPLKTQPKSLMPLPHTKLSEAEQLRRPFKSGRLGGRPRKAADSRKKPSTALAIRPSGALTPVRGSSVPQLIQAFQAQRESFLDTLTCTVRLASYKTHVISGYLHSGYHPTLAAQCGYTGRGALSEYLGSKLTSMIVILLEGGGRLIEYTSAQWHYWLVQLLDLVETLPERLSNYRRQAAEALQQATVLVQQGQKHAQVQIKELAARISSGRETEAAKAVVNDAVRGAFIVQNSAGEWIKSLATKASATKGERSGLKGVNELTHDASRGAQVMMDRASLLVSHTAKRLKAEGEKLHQRIKAGPDHPMAKKANQARETYADSWGRAIRRADEQLDYWFFSNEH